MVLNTPTRSRPVRSVVTTALTIIAAIIAAILIVHALYHGSSLRLVRWTKGSLLLTAVFDGIAIAVALQSRHHHADLSLVGLSPVDYAAHPAAAQDEYPVREFKQDVEVLSYIYSLDRKSVV